MWITTNTKCKVPELRIFTIQENSNTFVEYFDEVQDQLKTLASMDDLLSGIYAGIKICHCSIKSTASKKKNEIFDAMYSRDCNNSKH